GASATSARAAAISNPPKSPLKRPSAALSPPHCPGWPEPHAPHSPTWPALEDGRRPRSRGVRVARGGVVLAHLSGRAVGARGGGRVRRQAGEGRRARGGGDAGARAGHIARAASRERGRTAGHRDGGGAVPGAHLVRGGAAARGDGAATAAAAG